MINKIKKKLSSSNKSYNIKVKGVIGGKNYKHHLYLYKEAKDVNNMTKSYIKFELIDKNTKTNVYSVKNKNSNILLGFIKWYGAWRQYCFFPINSTVYSRGCMKDINNFINKIMEERKN